MLGRFFRSPSSLSLAELLDSFLLLPSLLSHLTVGGSPPESPPISKDFSCRCSFSMIRRWEDWPQYRIIFHIRMKKPKPCFFSFSFTSARHPAASRRATGHVPHPNLFEPIWSLLVAKIFSAFILRGKPGSPTSLHLRSCPRQAVQLPAQPLMRPLTSLFQNF